MLPFPPMRCKALLLDLDGVLGDTEPLHIRAWEHVFDELGLPQKGSDWSYPVGIPAQDVARRVVETVATGYTAADVLERKRLNLRRIVASVLVPFPGLKEELALWKDVPVAVATSGTRAEALLMLEVMGIRDAFRIVVAWEDVLRQKPAPDGYLRAAGLLGVPPADCAAVEDSPRGLEAAVAAGVLALAVPPVADAPLPSGAAAGFPSTVDALRWLRE